MKYLNLIRHAKSSWADDSLDDRERPLNKRGRKQVGFMAPVLHERLAFDAELHVSPARRAADTIGFLLDHAGVGECAHMVQYHEDLYTFDADDLWQWLARERTGDALTLVGHNPALLDLVNRLLAEPLPELPTCSLVQIRLPIDRWRDLEAGCGVLTGYLVPAWVDFKTFRKQRPRKPAAFDAHDLFKRTRALFVYQSDMILALEPGVRVGADPEFLHQYRTHLRRSRSVGQALLRLRRNKPLKRQLKGLKAEAQATSALRDLDVLLMRIRDWEAEEAYRPALKTMHVFATFKAYREARQKDLVQRLESETHRERLENWRHFLDSTELKKVADAVTPRAVQAAVDELVAEHDQRLESLTEESPDSDFHELRKVLKKLRYLLELMVDSRRKRMKALKYRQKRFGAFQDLTVQLRFLEEFQEEAVSIEPGFHGLMKDLSEARLEERRAILEMAPFTRFTVQ